MSNERVAVSDWATDYDIFDETYIEDPYPIWQDLRDRCPIAHTERFGGSWLPTSYEDVTAIARDVEHFSSRGVSVVPPPDGERDGEAPLLAAGVPPITSDPPVHTWARRLLLPWFAPRKVEEYSASTRALCRRLLDGFADAGRADAAADYAQQIPVRVIGELLGVPEERSDTFVGWVRDILEFAHDAERRQGGIAALVGYFNELIDEREGGDGTDLISELLRAEVEGEPVPRAHVLGTAALTLVAGIDTTWSAIGSSLWHLATHADDRRRLAAERELLPLAIEEFLRAYSPVTMGRIVVDAIEFEGCPMQAGDRVLLNFPGANRDPAEFDEPDRVIIDRQRNRHVAFGAGIHRCAGSNLARMEMRVALEEWMARIPEFELDPDGDVTWAGGQVRGPRTVPVVFPTDGET